MNRLKYIKITVILSAVLFAFSATEAADIQETMLIHLKTGLKHNDAQICVAYNEIWAALESQLKVNVLIDADAVNTFKIGWFGKDDIEEYKLPENLRKSLAKEFGVSEDSVPKTYGEYLLMLKKQGAKFYINGAMLVVAGISKQFGDLEKVSSKFFKPITLKEMVKLRTEADYYMVY